MPRECSDKRYESVLHHGSGEGVKPRLSQVGICEVHEGRMEKPLRASGEIRRELMRWILGQIHVHHICTHPQYRGQIRIRCQVRISLVEFKVRVLMSLKKQVINAHRCVEKGLCI